MTFKALLIEKDDAGYRAAVKDVGDEVLGSGEVTVAGGLVHDQLQGRPGHHRQEPGGAQVPAGGRHRPGRHRGRKQRPALQALAMRCCSTATAWARRTPAAWPSGRG